MLWECVKTIFRRNTIEPFYRRFLKKKIWMVFKGISPVTVKEGFANRDSPLDKWHIDMVSAVAVFYVGILWV